MGQNCTKFHNTTQNYMNKTTQYYTKLQKVIQNYRNKTTENFKMVLQWYSKLNNSIICFNYNILFYLFNGN